MCIFCNYNTCNATFPTNATATYFIIRIYLETSGLNFFVFSCRHNPLLPDNLKIGDDEALAKSHFNFSEPTVLFFHAFFESSQGATAIMIRTGKKEIYRSQSLNKVWLLMQCNFKQMPEFFYWKHSRMIKFYLLITSVPFGLLI